MAFLFDGRKGLQPKGRRLGGAPGTKPVAALSHPGPQSSPLAQLRIQLLIPPGDSHSGAVSAERSHGSTRRQRASLRGQPQLQRQSAPHAESRGAILHGNLPPSVDSSPLLRPPMPGTWKNFTFQDHYKEPRLVKGTLTPFQGYGFPGMGSGFPGLGA